MEAASCTPGTGPSPTATCPTGCTKAPSRSTARAERGIVQFIGEWEDPVTRSVTVCAVFLRPEGGGTEWIVADHDALNPG